jgi:hypothetical protein
MRYAKFEVRVDAATLKDVTTNALEVRALDVDWADDRHAVAERGSLRGLFAFGPWLPYLRIRVTLRTTTEGCVLRLDKTDSGWVGGLFGVVAVDRRFERLAYEFEKAFRETGVLVAASDG